MKKIDSNKDCFYITPDQMRVIHRGILAAMSILIFRKFDGWEEEIVKASEEMDIVLREQLKRNGQLGIFK